MSSWKKEKKIHLVDKILWPFSSYRNTRFVYKQRQAEIGNATPSLNFRYLKITCFL